MVNLEAIIYYLFLLDSIGANIVVWCCPRWFNKKFSFITKYVPVTKIWCALYLFLVLWIGYALYRLGIVF